MKKLKEIAISKPFQQALLILVPYQLIGYGAFLLVGGIVPFFRMPLAWVFGFGVLVGAVAYAMIQKTKRDTDSVSQKQVSLFASLLLSLIIVLFFLYFRTLLLPPSHSMVLNTLVVILVAFCSFAPSFALTWTGLSIGDWLCLKIQRSGKAGE